MRLWYYCKPCDYEFVRPDKHRPDASGCPLCDKECEIIDISTWNKTRCDYCGNVINNEYRIERNSKFCSDFCEGTITGKTGEN